MFIKNGYAQDHRYGIKGGITTYQIQGERVLVRGGESTNLDTDSEIGIEAGFFAEFRVSKSFSIQPEVVYAQKGGNRIPGIDIVRDIKLDYIDFPVLLKFRAPVSSKIIPYLFGGPYGSVLIRGKGDFEWYDKEGVTITDQYKNLAYGVKFGVGVEIGRLLVDGRYDLGISDIDKEDGLDGYVRGFVISLGIML